MVHQLFTAVPVKKTMTNNRPGEEPSGCAAGTHPVHLLDPWLDRLAVQRVNRDVTGDAHELPVVSAKMGTAPPARGGRPWGRQSLKCALWMATVGSVAHKVSA